MGVLTTEGKNSGLSGLPSTVYVALHSGAPGADGSANELSGGSPAYARKAATLNAASAGARTLGASVSFDIPPSTVVTYASLWSAVTGGTCLATDDVTSESFTGQGTYVLTDFQVSITD